MPSIRSLVRLRFPATAVASSGARRVLHHFGLALVLHALAGACFAPLPGRIAERPATVIAVLLVALLLWVVPRARVRVLARVGEALVIAGAVLAIAQCARIVFAA